MTNFYAIWHHEFEGLDYGNYTTSLNEWYCREMCASSIDPFGALLTRTVPYEGSRQAQLGAQMHLMHILLRHHPMRMSVDVYFEPNRWTAIQRSPELLQRIFDTFSNLYNVEIVQNISNEFTEVWSQRTHPLIGYRISGDERAYPCFYWVQLLVRHLTHCKYPADMTLEKLIDDAADYNDNLYPDNDSEDQLEAWNLLLEGKETPAIQMVACNNGPKSALYADEDYWERAAGRAMRAYHKDIMTVTTIEQVLALLEKAYV